MSDENKATGGDDLLFCNQGVHRSRRHRSSSAFHYQRRPCYRYLHIVGCPTAPAQIGAFQETLKSCGKQKIRTIGHLFRGPFSHHGLSVVNVQLIRKRVCTTIGVRVVQQRDPALFIEHDGLPIRNKRNRPLFTCVERRNTKSRESINGLLMRMAV